VIEFENASYAYGRALVLRDINLTLQPGSFHFLVGPSGSGKTTFLRLCFCDLFPTEGQARFFGRRIAPNNRKAISELRRAVGVVPQESRFLDHLTVLENIALPLQVSGIDMRARAGDLTALLEWVDLSGRAGDYPAELSGAERVRAAVARAVILSPELILLDEPTGHLDWAMAARVLALLIELNRMRKAVVVATHDDKLIRAADSQVAAGLLCIEDGRVGRLEPAA